MATSRKVIAVLVAQVAPPHPPCFADRRAWLSYLDGAIDAHRQGHAGSVLMATNPPTFNFRLRFCEDCTAQRSIAMHQANKCDPEHLRRLEPSSAALAHITAAVTVNPSLQRLPEPAPALPEWLPMAEWGAFVAMRGKKGLPLNDLARNRLIERLAQARSRGTDIAERLREAADMGTRVPRLP